MKAVKVGILACGALLLVMLLAGQLFGSFVDFAKADTANAALLVVAFAVPIAVGAFALAKPPFLQWQAIVATSGFAVAVVKVKLWDALPHIADAGATGVLIMTALVVGLVLSILAIAKPENA